MPCMATRVCTDSTVCGTEETNGAAAGRLAAYLETGGMVYTGRLEGSKIEVTFNICNTHARIASPFFF